MILRVAEILRGVGTQLLKLRSGEAIQGRWEGSQFKAKADQVAHEMLSEGLRRIEPSIPIISEEDSSSHAERRPDRYWLIDPIDGTASFAEGYAGFVTQAALVIAHRPLMGVVYAPVMDILYHAERGKGAFLNNGRLLCAPKGRMETLIDNYPEPLGITFAAFNNLKFKRYVECGSISLKICRVADGTADIFFKDILVRTWDLAAPQVILEEAGGFLKDIQGCDIDYAASFEKAGVVAAGNEDSVMRLINWYAKRGKNDKRTERKF